MQKKKNYSLPGEGETWQAHDGNMEYESYSLFLIFRFIIKSWQLSYNISLNYSYDVFSISFKIFLPWTFLKFYINVHTYNRFGFLGSVFTFTFNFMLSSSTVFHEKNFCYMSLMTIRQTSLLWDSCWACFSRYLYILHYATVNFVS